MQAAETESPAQNLRGKERRHILRGLWRHMSHPIEWQPRNLQLCAKASSSGSGSGGAGGRSGSAGPLPEGRREAAAAASAAAAAAAAAAAPLSTMSRNSPWQRTKCRTLGLLSSAAAALGANLAVSGNAGGGTVAGTRETGSINLRVISSQKFCDGRACFEAEAAEPGGRGGGGGGGGREGRDVGDGVRGLATSTDSATEDSTESSCCCRCCCLCCCKEV